MPASFFAKTLRRGGLWGVWVCPPGVGVRGLSSVFGCGVGLVFWVWWAWCCVFLFMFLFGYAGCGLVCFW